MGRHAWRVGSNPWDTEDVVTGGRVGRDPSALLASDGSLYVTYEAQFAVTDINGVVIRWDSELHLATRSPVDGWSDKPLDARRSAGRYSSLVEHASGALSVIYYDNTNQDVRHAYRCP